jgi:hypothetical protein
MALYVEDSWPEESGPPEWDLRPPRTNAYVLSQATPLKATATSLNGETGSEPLTPASRASVSIFAHYTPDDHDELSYITTLVRHVFADSSNKDNKPTGDTEEPPDAHRQETDAGATAMREKDSELSELSDPKAATDRTVTGELTVQERAAAAAAEEKVRNKRAKEKDGKKKAGKAGKGKQQQGGNKTGKAARAQEDDAKGAGEQKVPEAEKEEKEKKGTAGKLGKDQQGCKGTDRDGGRKPEKAKKEEKEKAGKTGKGKTQQCCKEGDRDGGRKAEKAEKEAQEKTGKTVKGKKQQCCKDTDSNGGRKRMAACAQEDEAEKETGTTGKGMKQQGCKETDTDGGRKRKADKEGKEKAGKTAEGKKQQGCKQADSRKRKAACAQEDDTEGAGEQKVPKARGMAECSTFAGRRAPMNEMKLLYFNGVRSTFYLMSQEFGVCFTWKQQREYWKFVGEKKGEVLEKVAREWFAKTILE